MPDDRMSSSDLLLQRLQALAQESKGLPDLGKAVKIYGAIMPILRDADLDVGQISMTSEQARTKLEAGQPLLQGLELELDIEAARDLIILLSAALHKVGDEFDLSLSGAARRIRSAIGEDKLDIGYLLAHVISGARGTVASVALDIQLDENLLWMLAQNALKPALRAWSRQLTPLADGIQWDKGYCFICGADASLGELRDDNQARHLRCGQCGSDWRVGRLQCIYCGNEDHNTLSFLQPEGNPDNARAEVCGKCNGYLKVITAFAPTATEMLALEDLATLHLDYIAQGKGFLNADARRTASGGDGAPPYCLL